MADKVLKRLSKKADLLTMVNLMEVRGMRVHFDGSIPKFCEVSSLEFVPPTLYFTGSTYAIALREAFEYLMIKGLR